MVMTMPKIPAIKVFTPISLKAFCRSSFLAAFATASSVAQAMTIKRSVWSRKGLVLVLQAKFAPL